MLVLRERGLSGILAFWRNQMMALHRAMNAIQLPINLHRFDLNLLKTLLALDEERNVQRAAARLFVTPSAVSHALARLRQVFADPIFVRSGSQLVPTSRCTAVVMAIRPLLGEVSQILDTSASVERSGFDPSSLARTMIVVMPGALELSLLPRLAATLAQQAPCSKLVVRSFERRSYEVDLMSGEADVVLSVGGHTPPREDIWKEVLWEDELVALQGPQGPLPSDATVDFDTVLDCPTVYPVPWPQSQNYLDIRLAREGRQRPIAISMPSYGAMGDLLRATSLVATMPDRTALADIANHLDLRLVRITPTIRTPLSIEVSARFRATAAGSWFYSQLLSFSAEIPHL
jgi:DNA-binding transcriptional LysR family regulator